MVGFKTDANEVKEAQGSLQPIDELTLEEIRELPLEDLIDLILEQNCVSAHNGKKVVQVALKKREEIHKIVTEKSAAATRDWRWAVPQAAAIALGVFGNITPQGWTAERWKSLAEGGKEMMGAVSKIDEAGINARKIQIHGEETLVAALVQGKETIDQTLKGNQDKASQEIDKVLRARNEGNTGMLR